MPPAPLSTCVPRARVRWNAARKQSRTLDVETVGTPGLLNVNQRFDGLDIACLRYATALFRSYGFALKSVGTTWAFAADAALVQPGAELAKESQKFAQSAINRRRLSNKVPRA